MSSTLRPTSCACASLRRAQRAVSHLYDLVLVPAHIKASQFMILQAIAESDEIAQCDLAREFALSVETLSRRLSSARRSGWVEMHTGDRGKRFYRLTRKGSEALECCFPYWEHAQMRLKEAMGDADWEASMSLIGRLSEAALRAESLPLSNGHRSLVCSHR